METLDDPVGELAAELAGTTEAKTRELLFIKRAAQFGITSFAYLNSTTQRAPWYVETNYPTEWVEHYVANNYAGVDVVMLESQRSTLSFQWRAALTKPGYGPETHRVFRDAAEFGIHDGYTVPIHGPGGVTFLSMATEDHSLFAPNALARRHALQLMSYTYHMACERSLAEAPPPAPPIRLTPRETEVLLWASKGKTGWEIAQILHLSERTVTYHVENAKAKLGTATRSHAVVKAITLGLICP